MKLRTKASLFLSILLAAIFLGQAAYFQYFLEETLLGQTHHRQEEIARLLADRLDAVIRGAQTDLLNIAANLDFRTLQERRIPALESDLRAVYSHNSLFDNGFFILDSQGRGLVDYPVGSDFRGKDFSFREYFQKTRDEKRPVISKSYISRRTGAPVITFTAPLKSYDGALFGVIAGSVNLLRDNLFGLFKGNQIGRTGKIMIYDLKGQLIFHPDPEIILKEARPSEYRLAPEQFLPGARHDSPRRARRDGSLHFVQPDEQHGLGGGPADRIPGNIGPGGGHEEGCFSGPAAGPDRRHRGRDLGHGHPGQAHSGPQPEY